MDKEYDVLVVDVYEKENDMDSNIDLLIKKLPVSIESKIRSLPQEVIDRFEEIRIKSFCNTLIITNSEEISLNDADEITPDVLEEILNRLLNYSYYAYEEELSKGYITIQGGHRVGLCGRVTLKNGKVHLIKDITSLNIRHGRQILGACETVISALYDVNSKTVANTLIIAPPKCGKTTVLRDIARVLSNNGLRVGICDERSEIAGSCCGKTTYDVGVRSDVLDGCPKAQGITMLIRAMSPDVIITDEIGKEEDVRSIEDALASGVKIITSIHGKCYEEICSSAIGKLIKEHRFETLIFLSSEPVTGAVKRIMKLGDGKKEVS